VWTAVRVWRRFRFPLLAVFGTLPVAVVLTARLFPPFRQWLWIWPVCYVLLDAVGVSVRGKWRLVYAAAELAAAGVLTWVSVVLSGSLWALLLPPVYVFLLMYGMAIPKECRDEVISRLVYQISVLLHILGQVLLSDRSARGWLLGAFFVFALLALISMNYENLHFATGGRLKITKSMRRKNLLMTLALFGIAALCSMLPVLAKLAGMAFAGAAKLLVQALGALAYLRFLHTSGANVRPGAEIGEPTENAGDSFFGFLSGAVILATGVFLVGISLYGCWQLLRKLPSLLRAIAASKERDADEADYTDEITDTRLDTPKRKREISAPERNLPPDQRIRGRFRHLLKKHPEWDSGATARETISEKAASIYERVRYSHHPVTEEDARIFREETEAALRKNTKAAGNNRG